MAELFSVFCDQGQAGGATAGFVAENQTEFKTFGEVTEIGRMYTVSAGSAEEAIAGVRKAFGGPTANKYKAVKKSSWTEEVPVK